MVQYTSVSSLTLTGKKLSVSRQSLLKLKCLIKEGDETVQVWAQDQSSSQFFSLLLFSEFKLYPQTGSLHLKAMVTILCHLYPRVLGHSNSITNPETSTEKDCWWMLVVTLHRTRYMGVHLMLGTSSKLERLGHEELESLL